MLSGSSSQHLARLYTASLRVYILFQVIINVLLRRELYEKNPLSKWVLLGALEILQGRTPNLTPTMLSQLVNASQHTEKSYIHS